LNPIEGSLCKDRAELTGEHHEQTPCALISILVSTAELPLPSILVSLIILSRSLSLLHLAIFFHLSFKFYLSTMTLFTPSGDLAWLGLAVFMLCLVQ